MQRILHFSIILLTMLVGAQAQAQTSDLTVSFLSLTNGEIIPAPLLLQVTLTESSNRVVSVEYFANGQSIGVTSNFMVFLPPPKTPASPLAQPASVATIIFFQPRLPFSLTWNPAPGDYVLTAKATDDQGNTALSDSINITIILAPVVTVESTESIASPSGPGVFTISRAGETNNDLNVQFFMIGTALNGVDYAEVSNSVTIPAGQFSANVVIDPLIYTRGNSKAVTLTMWSMAEPAIAWVIPFNPPYFVGSPDNATVYLKANERNHHKPSVKLIQPRNRQPLFPLGSNISIEANTFDRDTYVAKVEFFDGTTKLGESSSLTSTPPGQVVLFNFNWTNAPIGSHVLRARATDSQNATQVSNPVRIQVLPAP